MNPTSGLGGEGAASGKELVTSDMTASNGGEALEALRKAVSAAREAQKEWGALPVKARARILSQMKGFLSDRAEHLVQAISSDTGKTRVEALATEIIPAQIALRYYIRMAHRFLKPRIVLPSSLLLANKWSKLLRVPCGVVGVISPWNYPFSIPFSEILTGLVAGNAVIFKGSSASRRVSDLIDACFRACELPKGLFQMIRMPGSIAGDALLGSGIDKLFFTGSVSVGKKLMARAAETLTPISLELGGNDAMLVCEDADLDRATSGAVWAGLQNCGQSCGGVERIYVSEGVYEDFMEMLKRKVEALRVGSGTDYDTDIGAMTTDSQLGTVRRHLDDALARGAVIEARSAMPELVTGRYIAPVVLTGVNHQMLVMKEETFGPVLGVMKVKDMEEAIGLANDSIYGLTGSVWSRNIQRAERIGKRLEAGVITINDHLMSHGMPETPWGGCKASGMGRTHGEAGFHEMTQTRVIVHDVLYFAKRDLWWQPYNEKVYRGLSGAMQIFYGSGFKKRAAGIRSLLKILPRLFN
jgi:acyl-CoA reductase-like NAD-dependent aldehyde dehydrogenase